MSRRKQLVELSPAAIITMLKGADAMCPGCKFDNEVPENLHGSAVHRIGGKPYECHANTEAWSEVPEFKDQQPKDQGEAT